MKKIIAILILFYVDLVHSFYWDDCKAFLSTSISGFEIVVSTSQFSSSTGVCSATRKSREKERKKFFMSNVEAIKNDIVKGSGETLTVLIEFRECRSFSKGLIEADLKRNFDLMFSPDLEKSYSNVTSYIDHHCNSAASNYTKRPKIKK